MHIHILGIGGTFMAGVALLARAAGHRVTGSDQSLYPPMSTQLAEAGIDVMEGYDPAQLSPVPDRVVIGNALSRGNPAVEHVLDAGLDYTSGPQWLAEQVLQGRWVLAVAGTHGKTTTASMLAWILEQAGLAPGFLIGGIPQAFGISARLGHSDFFVVEADEYDTAFFDKRSKFVHYRPRTLILNNLEFDHADIFDDLEAIKRQFHHLIRTVPGRGLIVRNAADAALDDVLARGCWTPCLSFGDGGICRSSETNADDSRFRVMVDDSPAGTVDWSLNGRHNRDNALAAIAAARHAGVAPTDAVVALSRFAGVKRRMEWRGEAGGVAVYDDFAHHPTAIARSLSGLRAGGRDGRILAVLEPRSNTMRMGVHKASLAQALADADRSFVYRSPDIEWDLTAALRPLGEAVEIDADIDALVTRIVAAAEPGDRVVVMSNGGFGGIHDKLLRGLRTKEADKR